MHKASKLSIANDIFEICIKLNLETKRGNDTSVIINKLREKLESLANFSTTPSPVDGRREKVPAPLS